MDKITISKLTLTAVGGIFSLATIMFVLNYKTENTVQAKKHYLPYQYSVLSEDSAYFLEAIRTASNYSFENRHRQSVPRIGIVSHHLLIKNLIAEYFSRLSSEIQPATIILIGPNHHCRGTNGFAISRLPWKTPFGLLQPDTSLINNLLKTGYVWENEDAFYNEHSMGGIVPFLRYYFPQTKIVTIIVRPDVDTVSVIKLSTYFSDNLSKNDFILASLDFSHYKESAVAAQEDSITIRVLKSIDENHWNNAYTDSRKTLMLLLLVARQVHSTDFEIISHSNSGIITNDFKAPCTSYINSVFRESRY